MLAIILPPRKIEDPAFRDRLQKLAELYPGRCYLAGTMLFRGNDARTTQRPRRPRGANRHTPGCLPKNDVHYHTPERRALHDVVTAIRLKCTVENLGFHRFASGERHSEARRRNAPTVPRSTRKRSSASVKSLDRCQFSLRISSAIQYPVEYEGGADADAEAGAADVEGRRLPLPRRRS